VATTGLVLVVLLALHGLESRMGGKVKPDGAKVL